MKTKILSLAVFLMGLFSVNLASAQFTSDKVLIYLKAGQDPSQATNIVFIGYFADRDEICNGTFSGVYYMRQALSRHPNLLHSPYNLYEGRSTSYPPRLCKYDAAVSTSKYRVYSGHKRASYGFSGEYFPAHTRYWAFSKDGKQMITWISDNEHNRTTYLLTELSEFDPSTSSSKKYDFLE